MKELQLHPDLSLSSLASDLSRLINLKCTSKNSALIQRIDQQISYVQARFDLLQDKAESEYLRGQK